MPQHDTEVILNIILNIIFGIILTYGIGLIPALLFRYLIFKRPVSKIRAICICFIWFIIWSVIIFSLKEAAGESPRLSGGSFIMILVSYYILSKGYTAKRETSNNSKLSISCPQCGRSLRGVTKDMIGDVGVCTKCKAEFEIKLSGA